MHWLMIFHPFPLTRQPRPGFFPDGLNSPLKSEKDHSSNAGGRESNQIKVNQTTFLLLRPGIDTFPAALPSKNHRHGRRTA